MPESETHMGVLVKGVGVEGALQLLGSTGKSRVLLDSLNVEGRGSGS